jgi:hypothetical protein
MRSSLAQNMKMRTKAILAFIAGVIVITCCLGWYATSSSGPTNDLGLTRSDLAMGGHPDVEALRASTKTIADAYLAQHHAELARTCGGPYHLAVNYTLTPKVRTLGYRSSFYYFCWDIYLPYSLKTDSGEDYLVLIQLSDRTPGNKHDISKFRVLRAYVIDNAYQVKDQFNE